MSTILGIDPGRTGALAWFASEPDHDRLDIIDMPDLTGAALGARLGDLILADRPTVAWVERVNYMPGQRGVWTFAEGYGVILGTLGALGVPVRHVTPAVWKKAARLGKDKTAARQLACELWPDQSDLFARVKDDGRAEAALIALHGWRGGT